MSNIINENREIVCYENKSYLSGFSIIHQMFQNQIDYKKKLKNDSK